METPDLFGKAMLDYMTGLGTNTLKVRTQAVKWEDLPVEHFFREPDDYPEVETIAMEKCRGRVLDMGAGAGAHALILQENGHLVTAVDNSPGAVKVMQQRGVKDARCENWEDFKGSNYDTILLLMNGIGLAGTLDGLLEFTEQWDAWLVEGGQVLFESTDVAYVYDFPAGSNPLELEPYYGEQTYVMKWGNEEVSFPWLFADKVTLGFQLQRLGWNMEVIFDDGNGSFLARATRA